MDKYSRALLVDAKEEYTRQLVTVLINPIYDGIKSIYEAAEKLAVQTELNILKTFQLLLSKTPKWEPEKINTEYERIKVVSECDYLENLITAVFVAHTKILAAIRFKNQSKKIDLDIPTGAHFVHSVYTECSRNFWKQPFLFNTSYSSLDLQRNLIDAEKIIKECILETVRKLLPVRNVLKQYLGDNFDDDQYSQYNEDDVTSQVSEHTKKHMRKLLKYEMDNTLVEEKDEKFSQVNIGGSKDSEADELIENFQKVLENEAKSNSKTQSDIDAILNDVENDQLTAENFDNKTIIEENKTVIEGLDNEEQIEEKQVINEQTEEEQVEEEQVNDEEYLDIQTVIEDESGKPESTFSFYEDAAEMN